MDSRTYLDKGNKALGLFDAGVIERFKSLPVACIYEKMKKKMKRFYLI